MSTSNGTTQEKTGSSESTDGTMEGPCAKKLRHSDPDLKIVLEFKTENDKPSQKIYPMYRSHLAQLSGFIDAALSVGMKEKTCNEITLPDVQPALFEKAMELLQDPTAIRSAKLQDAFDVLPFYHLYDFASGVKLCDHVLSEHFKQKPADDLNLLVRIVVIAHKCNLRLTQAPGIACLNKKFCLKRPEAFSEDQIRDLAPLFKEDLLSLPTELQGLPVDSVWFPKYFTKCMALKCVGGILDSLVVEIEIYNNRGDLVNTLRAKGRSFTEGGWRFPDVGRLEFDDGPHEVTFSLHQCSIHGGDWVLSCSRDDGKVIVLGRSISSANFKYPPEKRWIEVHESAEIMTVTYKHK